MISTTYEAVTRGLFRGAYIRPWNGPLRQPPDTAVQAPLAAPLHTLWSLLAGRGR